MAAQVRQYVTELRTKGSHAMIVENQLYPSSETIGSLLADVSDKRIVMLNLLKFRAHAAYDDGRKSDLTGREAYWIYADAMQKIVVREEGRLLFSGDILSVPIGKVEEIWDMAALIEYPSAAAFARIASSVEVSEIAVHRAAGLAGQLLIRTRSA
jgi:uncharacterized protein (DUF1330 family)